VRTNLAQLRAQICTRAGMATGGFYAHFGSKAEIYAAVVRQISADIGRRAGSVVMDTYCCQAGHRRTPVIQHACCLGIWQR
jgi:hypothetical protein